NCTVNGPGTVTNTATLRLFSTSFNPPLVNRGTLTCVLSSIGSPCNINGPFQNIAGATLSTGPQVIIASGFTNAGTISIAGELRVTAGTLVNVPGAQVNVVAASGQTLNAERSEEHTSTLQARRTLKRRLVHELN